MNTYKLANYTNEKPLILSLEDIWAAAYKWQIDTLGAYLVFPNTQRINLSEQIYFQTNGPRVISKSPNGAIQFADGNIYNYQRYNLILVNYSSIQTKHKSKYHSGYRGVTWDSSKNKWCAQLSKGGVRVFRQWHNTEVDAALAYNAAQLAINGPKAFQNKIVTT